MAGVAQSPPRRMQPAHVYSSLKSATGRLLRSVGGPEALAPETRGCAETLRNYQRPGHDSFAPIDVIVDAEMDAAFPLVTAQLARSAGYQLVPLPETLPGTGEIHTAMREAAEMIAAGATALADGRIDHTEAPALLAEIREAVRALNSAEQWLLDKFSHLKGES